MGAIRVSNPGRGKEIFLLDRTCRTAQMSIQLPVQWMREFFLSDKAAGA